MKEYGVVGDIDSIVSKRHQCLEEEIFVNTSLHHIQANPRLSRKICQ
jgi:hypothetical protein